MTTAVRLPAGRHGLSRAQVRDSQRSRMQRAMAEEVAANGYAGTPVAAVLARAGVSRETFYQHFANKEACFLSAYDAAASLVLGARTTTDIATALARYLGFLASEPEIARTFMVEVYAAGPAALERRGAVQQRFADAVAAMTGAEPFVAAALVATVIGMVTGEICAGRTERLEALHGPLIAFADAVLS